MKTNEGKIDRSLRIIIGLAVTSMVFWGPQSPWAILGLVPLVTGLIGVCPLYGLLRMDTCRPRSWRGHL